MVKWDANGGGYEHGAKRAQGGPTLEKIVVAVVPMKDERNFIYKSFGGAVFFFPVPGRYTVCAQYRYEDNNRENSD